MKTREEKVEYTKEWRKNNPEKVKEQNKKKYEKDKLENPERPLEKRKNTKNGTKIIKINTEIIRENGQRINFQILNIKYLTNLDINVQDVDLMIKEHCV